MSGLTDEQIAEGLKLAREMVAQPGLRLLMWGTLAATALALQAKLEQAEAERDEAREARRALQGVAQRIGKRYAEEYESDRQRARREAFEEAAKVMCLDCSVNYNEGEWEANTWLHTGQFASYKCQASPIRNRALTTPGEEGR